MLCELQLSESQGFEEFLEEHRSRVSRGPVFWEHYYLSVIIDDLNIMGIVSIPLEYNAPLGIDTKAPEASKFAGELFEAIAGRNTKESKGGSSIDLVQQSLCL